MTALEELIENVYERIRNFESKELYNDWLEELEQKYSVTLKEHDSAKDNIKPEQNIDQNKMMAEIEDIACEFADYVRNSTFPLLVKNTANFSSFKTKLKDCFAMYFKADSKPVNVSDEQSIGIDVTVSKIESLWCVLENKLRNDNFVYYLDDIRMMDNLIEELKIYRTMPNSDQNNSDNK